MPSPPKETVNDGLPGPELHLLHQVNRRDMNADKAITPPTQQPPTMKLRWRASAASCSALAAASRSLVRPSASAMALRARACNASSSYACMHEVSS